MSAILRLQKKCIEKHVDLQNLLREALLISSKLKLLDFKECINYELNGYPIPKNSPKYRYIQQTLKFFNPYRWWTPTQYDEKYESILAHTNIIQSIGELEYIIKKTTMKYLFLWMQE